MANNGKKLDLPTPNTFLPKNFDVVKANSDLSKTPVLVKQWDGTDLWLKKDDKFDTPKSTILCKTYTGDLYFGETPRARVFAIMWKEILESMMCELNYKADMAAMSFDLTLSRNTIDMKWSGFSDSLGAYVKESLEFIASIRGKDFKEVFEQIKAKKL